MATPKKLKSGHWRAQVYLGKRDGKAVYASVTAPTKAECAFKAAQLKAEGKPEAPAGTLTVGEAVDRYIESCATLSPTTLSGYRKIRRCWFPDLMPLKVSTLNAETMQKAINAEMARQTKRRHNLSSKTIKNAYGLISAALRHVCGLSFDVKLPKAAPRFLELPEPDVVMAAIRGSDVELPCMLALWLSLSMSEVRGLKYSSIRHGCLYIDQVVVDVDGKPVEKSRAKTDTRSRVLALPQELLSLICARTPLEEYQDGLIPDGYLIPLPGYIIQRHFEKLVPGMTFHQLRHLNASVMLQLNVPEKYAMERGGWSTPAVMKTVYQHTFSAERRRVDAAIDSYFRQKYHTNISHEAVNR